MAASQAGQQPGRGGCCLDRKSVVCGLRRAPMQPCGSPALLAVPQAPWVQPQCPAVKAPLLLGEQPGLCPHGCCCPAELMLRGAVSVPGSGLHQPHPSPAVGGEEVVRGIAVEKFDIVKKWGINTYKVSSFLGLSGWPGLLPGPRSRLRVGPAPALGAKSSGRWRTRLGISPQNS